jgi:hypothetical protein
MDEDLKQYLEAMEARLNQGIRAQAEPLAAAIASVSTEMAEGFKEVNGRLEAIQTRLDLQGGKIRAGTLWTARIDEWSDKVDHLIAERDKDLSELRSDVRAIQKQMRGGKP